MGRTRDRQLLHAISDAVLAILGERRPERSLRRLVESARSLVGAKYAALGIPDEGGEEFRQFIFTGMSDELVAKIGPLPRRHGLLAAMLKEASAYRTADVRQDPRFEWWPDAHPRMSSFLGVPIVSGDEVIAALYLTDKIGAPEFSDEDQEAIEMLAAHAAVAIENARLHERSRELSAVEERNRLAREPARQRQANAVQHLADGGGDGPADRVAAGGGEGAGRDAARPRPPGRRRDAVAHLRAAPGGA